MLCLFIILKSKDQIHHLWGSEMHIFKATRLYEWQNLISIFTHVLIFHSPCIFDSTDKFFEVVSSMPYSEELFSQMSKLFDKFGFIISRGMI